MAFERMRVFTGNANPKLAEAVCKHLNVSLGRCLVGKFSDGEVMLSPLKADTGINDKCSNPSCFAKPE